MQKEFISKIELQTDQTSKNILFPASSKNKNNLENLYIALNGFLNYIEIDKKSVIITSAIRDKKNPNYSKNSAHSSYEAVDLKRTTEMEDIIRNKPDLFIEGIKKYNLIIEDLRFTKTWIHLQTRLTSSFKKWRLRQFVPYSLKQAIKLGWNETEYFTLLNERKHINL